MAENEQDVLARAFATLSSLRKNINQMGSVPETYVHEYHRVLDKLENIKIDVSEFRIPESEIKPKVTSINIISGETKYSSEKYVSEKYLLTKIDAILGYFEIITSEKPRRIGFTN